MSIPKSSSGYLSATNVKAGQDLTSLIEGATLAMITGNLPKAERLSLEVLESDPNSARAHLMLGIVKQRMLRSAEAVTHLTRAYELNPNSFDAASCLAALYRIAGELDKAVPFAEKAARLKPNEAAPQMELGSIYLERMRLHEAEQSLRRAAKLSPEDLHISLALNQCLDRLGKHEESLEILRAAICGKPISTDDLLRYGTIVLAQGNPNAAVVATREALQQEPRMLRARAQLARSLIEAGNGQEATDLLDDPVTTECLRSESGDSESLTVIGMAFQSMGRSEEARNTLRLAIAAPNPVGLSYYAYLYSGVAKDVELSIVETIEALLAGQNHPSDLTPLHFALGKAYEDLGDFERAMQQYDAANSSERQQQSEPKSFDHMAAGSSADQTISTFTPAFFASNSGHGNESDLPVFVVGMIRSGTTLAEQILSSHPSVGGAGEVPFWVYNTLDVMDAEHGLIRPDRLQDAAERYVALLKSLHPGKARVVDKMPVNFKNLGTLHLGLPNARFIHMRRNPVDTCLSIYSTHSRAIGDSGNDKGNLVDSYRQYLKVMDQWRKVLPVDRLLEVDYEDLVLKGEPTIRRMIEFCGLEWDDACLRPEANPRAVATPSLWQVRRPINSASIGRRKKFEPWLGEFKELLNDQ